MHQNAIEEFGKRLVAYGRDEGIQVSDLLNSDHAVSTAAARWRAAEVSAGGVVPAAMVIADCVDQTIFKLFYAMDDADFLHLSLTTQDGQSVDISVVGWGEPAGWYAGTREWRAWYSKERMVDREDDAHIVAQLGTQDLPDDPPPNLDDLEMPRRAIEELGILLVRHVRDVAIPSCDLQLLPHSQTPVAKRWRQAAAQNNGKVPPDVLIPDCVDETLFTFLRAIDKGQLPLSFTAENGQCVDLVKEGGGELATMFMRPGGWREQYTKQRFAKNA